MACKDFCTITNATALALLLSFFAYGIGCNVYGPTWPDLTRLFNVTDAYMGYAKTSQATAYTLGAFLCNFFFRFVPRNVMICMYIFVLGICKALTPWFGFWGFIALGITLSICEGGCDVGFNVSTLALYKDERHHGWLMQLMHFMYGAGGLLIFTICKPFLAPDHEDHPPDPSNGTVPGPPEPHATPSFKQLLARHPPVPQPSFNTVPFSSSLYTSNSTAFCHSTNCSFNDLNDEGVHFIHNVASSLTVEFSNSSGNSSQSDGVYHTQIQIPYGIVGLIYLAVALYWAVILICAQCRSKKSTSPPSTPSSSLSCSGDDYEDEKEKNGVIRRVDSEAGDFSYCTEDDQQGLIDTTSTEVDEASECFTTMDMVRLSLAVLIMGIYNSQESNSFTFLYTYLDYSGIDKNTAADMNSIFSLVYNGSRFAAIIAASLFNSKWIIFLCIPFSTASLVALALVGGGGKGNYLPALPDTQDQVLLTWHLVIALAASYSGVYPAMFAYINQKVQITERVGSLIIIICGIFLGTTPMILGNFIHDMPSILPICLLGHAAIVIPCLIIFSCLPAPERRSSSTSSPGRSRTSSTAGLINPSTSTAIIVY